MPLVRRALLLALAVLIGGVIARLLRVSAPEEAAAPPPAVEPAAAPAAPRAVSTPAVSRAARLNAPDGDGERDVTVLRELTGAMLSALPPALRPPLGGNEDFTRVLRGQNRTGHVFIPAGHPALDARGRLVDRWGTPYHFHPVSSAWVEIRSAGPDRTLFTEDDFVDPWSRKKNRVFREENPR